jgi:hypothetical protein
MPLLEEFQTDINYFIKTIASLPRCFISHITSSGIIVPVCPQLSLLTIQQKSLPPRNLNIVLRFIIRPMRTNPSTHIRIVLIIPMLVLKPPLLTRTQVPLATRVVRTAIARSPPQSARRISVILRHDDRACRVPPSRLSVLFLRQVYQILLFSRQRRRRRAKILAAVMVVEVAMIVAGMFMVPL